MNKTRERQIADLPPEMITEVVRRLNTPGNAERARAVAKAWLAANKPANAARKATRRAQVLQALQAAERWLREDTVEDRRVVIRSTPPGPAELTVFARFEHYFDQVNPSLVWKVDLIRADEDDEGFQFSTRQTIYPRPAATVVMDTEVASYFGPDDVGPGGIQRLWTRMFFASKDPRGVLAGLISPNSGEALSRAMAFCRLNPAFKIDLWARPRRDAPARHYYQYGSGFGPWPSAFEEVLYVSVYTDDYALVQTIYPVATGVVSREEDGWLSKDVKNGRVAALRRLSDDGLLYQGDPELLARLLAVPSRPAAPNAVPDAGRAPGGTARQFTGASGKTYNLSMNGVLGHRAMQAQLNAAKAKGKRPANSSVYLGTRSKRSKA